MKKSILKQLLVILTAFTLVLGFGVSSVNVYAATSAQLIAIYNSVEGDTYRGNIEEALDGSDEPGDGLVRVQLGNTVKYCTSEQINKAYETALKQKDAATRAGQSAKNSTNQAKKNVKNMMKEFEVTADTSQAAVALAGVQQLVGVIVGILAYAVVIGMALFTGVDICYITMPVFRTWADDKGASGGAVTSSTNKDTGESKFRFVTDEAMFAVTQATVENGKNALGIYFKKRCIGWILTAIVLYVLLTGQITLLTDVILQFISGIVAALQSLGN